MVSGSNSISLLLSRPKKFFISACAKCKKKASVDIATDNQCQKMRYILIVRVGVKGLKFDFTSLEDMPKISKLRHKEDSELISGKRNA